MITQLSRLNPERLGVIARTSAMKYKGTKKSIKEIGAELGVAYVLEGSVRRALGRVRIAAQLIQVRDETHLWAQTYERSVIDILKLAERGGARNSPRNPRQADTAGGAAARREQRGRTTGLRGLFERAATCGTGAPKTACEKASHTNEQAIRLYPQYAMAYAGVADSYVMLACRGMVPAKDTFRKAKEAARKAIDLDSELGEAHGSLAHVRLHDWDWEGLEADFERAIDLNPAQAIVYYW